MQILSIVTALIIEMFGRHFQIESRDDGIHIFIWNPESESLTEYEPVFKQITFRSINAVVTFLSDNEQMIRETFPDDPYYVEHAGDVGFGSETL